LEAGRLNLQSKLRSHRAKIAIWGTGYIGLSTMAYYARYGIKCIGYDIVPETIKSINEGKVTMPGLGQWLGFSVEPFARDGLMRATSDVKEILEDPSVKVHFVAIPTEKNGKPWDGALQDVSKKISGKVVEDGPDVVIVESTLSPGQCDKVLVDTLTRTGRRVPNDFQIAVAPRRDWFDNPGLNVHTIPRVVGGYDQESLKAAEEVLGIICSKLVPVSDHRIAELVKSTENSFRALNIAFANALSRAYPDVNTVELINAAATKWNYVAHYPGMGTGGYCIPLAPEYLLEGSATKGEHTDLLSLINQVNRSQTKFVGDLINKSLSGGSVGILGLSYKRNLKVHVLSPSISLAETLKHGGNQVRIQDPFYSEQEVLKIVGVHSFKYPDDLKEFDSLVISVPHLEYTETPVPELLDSIRPGTFVLDAEGAWESYRDFFHQKQIDYRKIGDAGWATPRMKK
jgi:nucleotide sugar dehydrogenase